MKGYLGEFPGGLVWPVNPKRNQSWIFFGSTDAKAEAPVIWSLDAKSQLMGKDPDAEKDWRQEKKGMTEDKMVGWHHPIQWIWLWAKSER